MPYWTSCLLGELKSAIKIYQSMWFPVGYPLASHFWVTKYTFLKPRSPAWLIFLADRKFECYKCAKRYKRKIHLNSHLKYECGIEPQFRCHLCTKAFHQKSNLKVHLNVVHYKVGRTSRLPQDDVVELLYWLIIFLFFIFNYLNCLYILSLY